MNVNNSKNSTPSPIFITLRKSKWFLTHSKMIDFRMKYNIQLDDKIMRNLKIKQLAHFFKKFHRNLYWRKIKFLNNSV